MYKRISIREIITNKPYTTFVQAHTFKRKPTGMPMSEYNMEWAEITKGFAPTRALWLMMYIMYLINAIQLIIGLSIFTEFNLLEAIEIHGILKFILYFFILCFILYCIFAPLIHNMLITVVENIRFKTDKGYSREEEWGLILLQSIGFYLLTALLVYLIVLIF